MTEFPRKAGEWTELSRETVYENPWIEVQHSAILNPNGGEGIYGKVHFKNLAIGILAITNKDEIFLVGQERFPFNGTYSWEIIVSKISQISSHRLASAGRRTYCGNNFFQLRIKLVPTSQQQ